MKGLRIARVCAALLCLAALLSACGAGISESGGQGGASTAGTQRVELFAVSVGKGDALLIRVDDWVGLIDTGRPYARGKVLSAMEAMGANALDAVFITHTDGDHTGGLDWLAASGIPVGTWYASAMYTGVKPEKHPAVQAAASRGGEVIWLRRGDRVPLSDTGPVSGTGPVFEVLAPSVLNQEKDDNNSLVMMLETAEGRMLFTGDMELPEETVLLQEGGDLSCAVLKAPNHGDDDTLSEAFARAASAQVAVISTDSYEKPGTPDAGVLQRLSAAGTACYVTQDAGLGIRVTLSGGEAAMEYVDVDAPAEADVEIASARIASARIASVTAGDDLIAIQNDGEDLDMTGWYLYSDRGDELYAFPDGYVLKSGEAVTVGTRSSPADSYDLLWDDEKVVHRKKADNIALYDRWGRYADGMSNGL